MKKALRKASNNMGKVVIWILILYVVSIPIALLINMIL